MKYLILVLVALMAICFFGSREGFVDFGFSGYHKPVSDFSFADEAQAIDMSQYTRDVTKIPPNKINDIVEIVKSTIQNRTGRCMTPVQTIYINKYSSDKASVYDTRFMFFDPKHSFASEILAKLIQNNGSDEFMVGSIRTQVPSTYESGPVAFRGDTAGSTFEEYPQLLKDIAPSRDAFQAVSRAVKQNAVPL